MVAAQARRPERQRARNSLLEVPLLFTLIRAYVRQRSWVRDHSCHSTVTRCRSALPRRGTRSHGRRLTNMSYTHSRDGSVTSSEANETVFIH